VVLVIAFVGALYIAPPRREEQPVKGSFCRVTVLISCSFLLLSCGYQLVGRETHVPEGMKAVAVPTFQNQTYEPGIEILFTRAFLREFIQDRRVRVVERDRADSVLDGVIKYFYVAAVSFDRSGLATEYQTTVTVDLTLRKGTGEVLWQENNLSETRWYRVTSTNPVTSEQNKAVAIQQVGVLVAERVRNRFFSSF
jgi:outer membrane lipopolysaccharide assembly protein LptE/RlpB